MTCEIDEKKYSVYMLIFTNKKKYVGLTKRNCEQRKKEHISCSRNKNPRYILHKAIKLYGTVCIINVVIAIIISRIYNIDLIESLFSNLNLLLKFYFKLI